jgi:PAS domain S-box-containing protein
MFDAMKDGLMLISVEGQIEDVNDAQLRIFGCSRNEELIGLNVLDFISGKDRARFALALPIASPNKDDGGRAKYTFLTKDGKGFEAELRATRAFDRSGKETGYITVMRRLS